MTDKRKVGRPRTGVKRNTVWLKPEQWEKAKELGKGRHSVGIANALDNVPMPKMEKRV